jgi:S-(hydroxymethyl)glutathione dehydrogenase/alcohol dehydrogenase
VKSAKVSSGATCGIWGLGGVGSAVAQGCRAAGAKRVIGIDTNPAKFEFAMQMGCTECINPKDYAAGKFLEHLTTITDGGFDYTFECIGNVHTMRQALEACHKGWGESCIIGVAAAGTEISTRPFQLVTGRVWRGCAFGGYKGPTDLPILVDLYMNGKLKVDEYVTCRLPLSEVNRGFELMHEGHSIRTSLYFGDVPSK